MAEHSQVKSSDLFGTMRLDAEFYRRRYVENAARMRALPNTRTLGEVTTVFRKGIFDINASEYQESGVPFVRIGNLKGWVIDEAGIAFISPERHASDHKTALVRGDIVLSKTARPAASLVQLDQCNTSQDTIAVKTNRSASYNEFLVAFLNSSFGLTQLERLFQGNIQAHLSLDEARTVLIPEPDEAEIQEVSAIFGASRAAKAGAQDRYANAQALLADALGLSGLTLPTPKTYTAMFSDTAAAERLDAGYFHPEKLAMLAHLGRDGAQPLSAYVRSIRKMVTPSKRDPDVPVRNFDLPDALRFHLSDDVPATTFGELGSAKKAMQPGDVAVSRLRFYLKEVAVVRTESGLPVVGSSEFYVLRPVEGVGLRAEAVVVLLRSDAVQSILKWCQNGSAHPRFDERDLLSIPVPPSLLAVQDEIADLLNQSIDLEHESGRQLTEATARVEELVLAA